MYFFAIDENNIYYVWQDAWIGCPEQFTETQFWPLIQGTIKLGNQWCQKDFSEVAKHNQELADEAKLTEEQREIRRSFGKRFLELDNGHIRARNALKKERQSTMFPE